MVDEYQKNRDPEDLYRTGDVPIGYQEQERYHEWIKRMLREERENNLK